MAAYAARVQDEPRTEPKQRLSPLDGHPPAVDAFAMVREALARRSNDEPVLYQELGHWLGQDYNLRPRAWYGVPFSVFMDAAAQEGVIELTTSGGNSYASLPKVAGENGHDENGDDYDERDRDDNSGSNVQLESLRAEEREALFTALRDLEDDERFHYLTFRTILSHLMSRSVLPRLSEWQIRRLLNDLANREPPILIRGQKTGRNQAGTPYTFATFTLTSDTSLYQ